MLKIALVVALSVTSIAASHAIDNGQWSGVDPKIRDWLKSVRSPRGIPCCDIADGHRTDWEIRPYGYYVPVPWFPPGRENWIMVPPETIVHDAGNPIGDAVIWYVESSKYIRCFVPGGGV